MNLKTAIEHVLLATGGNPSTAIATENERIAQMINAAGNYLYSMPWRWREVHGETVTLPASSNYVELPEDFAELISITTNDSSVTVTETTPQHIEQLIGSSTTDSSTDLVAVVFNQGDQSTIDVAGTNGNAPKVYLKVFPTQSAEDADRYRISYRRGFRLFDDLTSTFTGSVEGSAVTDSLVSAGAGDGSNADNSNPTYEFQFPYYIDPLFCEYLRAFAMGYEQGNLSEQLLAIEAGPLYQRMIARDGTVQQTYGRLNLSVPPSFPVPAQNTVPNPV